MPAAQQQPAVRADAADAACSPDKVRDQIKDSWLVKKLLQQGPDSDSKQGVCATLAQVLIACPSHVCGSSVGSSRLPGVPSAARELLFTETCYHTASALRLLLLPRRICWQG